jgi:hypothetical protein
VYFDTALKYTSKLLVSLTTGEKYFDSSLSSRQDKLVRLSLSLIFKSRLEAHP